MSEKILYYMGAGASAKALPLARSVWSNEMVPDIRGLAYDLKTIDLNLVLSELGSGDYDDYLNDMKRRFDILAEKADEFGDVDTYAKYLHLMNPGGIELKQLKKALSEFFSIKQLVLEARDRRYLPWLTSIMNRKIFPENVKIINWNYDFQVELASARIGQLENVVHGSSSFTYSPSMISHYPNIDPTFSDFSSLALIHANGIAGFTRPEGFKTASIFQDEIAGNAHQVLSYISKESFQPLIHFAWEKSDYHSSLIKHVKEMIEKTTIMVVIGYSFPFFNREFDKEIFKQLKEEGTIRKIYYQDPILTGQQLKPQFNLASDFDIVHIENTNNFHIPFEY